MKFNLFSRHNESPVQSGFNPSDEELAQMRAGATGPGSETARQVAETEDRQARLAQAVEMGAAVVRNSEITGEVPMVTPDMTRPEDTTDGSPTSEAVAQEPTAEAVLPEPVVALDSDSTSHGQMAGV